MNYRNELHKLLDKMLDENQPIGVLQNCYIDNVLDKVYSDRFELRLNITSEIN